MGPIPTQLMPLTDTAPLTGATSDYLAESLALYLGGGEKHRERVTCPLATTAELPIIEDGQ